jgi:hypothetical protein
MAGIKRAFRRRLVWTLVAAVLAAATLTGCGDKDQQPDDDAVAGELTHLSTTWLAGFGAPSTDDLGCQWSGFDVEATPSDDLEACMQPTANGMSLRVRNQTGVPVTISGPGILRFQPVDSHDTVDIPLAAWYGDRFTYKPNVVTGVMTVLQDQLEDARAPEILKWLRCTVQDGIKCLADQAPELLPEKVRIGDLTVPLQQIAKLLTNLWDHRDLVKAFVGPIIGQDGGTLTLRPAARQTA